MLKCKDIVDQASDYLDHEMPFGRRMQYRMHLFICRHCRNFSRQFDASVAMLKRLPTRQQKHRAGIDSVKQKIDNL